MAMKSKRSILNPKNWGRGSTRQGGDPASPASPAGSDGLSPPTLKPLGLDPLQLSAGVSTTTPDPSMPIGCGTAPAGPTPDQNPVGEDGRANVNGAEFPLTSGQIAIYGHGNDITRLESGRNGTAWGSPRQIQHSAPDTTASMLGGEHGDRYQVKFSDEQAFLRAQGELPGTPSRGGLAQPAPGPVGGPPGGAYEVSGDSAQQTGRLQATAGANAAWERSNPKPQAGPPTCGTAAAVMPGKSFYITSDQPRLGPSASPVQPATVQPATVAMATSMGASLHSAGTVNEGPQFGSQGFPSSLPAETPTSKAPAQNESRRRQGSPGPPVAREMTPKTPLVSLPSTPAPLPQPVTGGADSRIRDFLESHRVMKPDPGYDWLSTLIAWISREQRKGQLELDKAEEGWRREKRLAEKLNQEIQDKDTKISQLRANHAQASEGEVRSKKELLKIDGELKKMQESHENCRKHCERLDVEIGHLTRQLEASRRQGAEWERRANAADERYQRASFDLSHANTEIEECQRARRTLALANEEKTRKIGELLAQVQSLNNKLDGIETQHANKLRAMHAEHASKLSTAAARYEDELAAKDGHISKLNTEHGHELAAKDQQMSLLVMKHKEDLAAKDSHMGLLVEQYEHKLTELEGSVDGKIDEATRRDRATISKQKQQIASYNKDDHAPINDAIFIRSFQALVQEVNQLASQIHQPAIIDFDRSLDPTNCLDRNASRRSWIWPRFVRNLCWNVLLRGFFGLPFGFGALGSQGEGYRVLYPTYQATAQVDPDGEPGSALAIPNDQKTNMGRAWLFEKILAAVCSDTGIETEYGVLFRGNVISVARELYDTLHHVLSGQIDPACFQRASDIAHKLGILALEMGTQRARVVLETCQYQDRSSPDEWKTDQAGSSGSSSAQVDFMMHPCLSRIGDGRRELHKKKVIVKGEFVPVWVGY